MPELHEEKPCEHPGKHNPHPYKEQPTEPPGRWWCPGVEQPEVSTTPPPPQEEAPVVHGAEEAWDACAREAHDLGWLHDWALSDLLARNPYRGGA